MQAVPYFSWLREFAVPAFFTLFGAALGYIATLIRDERKAKRDKQAFLRAVGMELDALSNQLDASLYEVKGSTDRVNGGSPTGPQFAAALRTAVFTSQVAKLRDVDDPLLISVVHYYSDLGTLQHILEMVNDLSAEFTRADAFSGQKESVRPRLLSTLIELQNQISIFGKRLRELRAKLPPAETPDKQITPQ
jgi:hypothetical protein